MTASGLRQELLGLRRRRRGCARTPRGRGRSSGASKSWPSGEKRWPSSPLGKFVGMRVPGIHSSGRRIQSAIQSCRSRVAAIWRFGASDARSTPGRLKSSIERGWHCAHFSSSNTFLPAAQLAGFVA